jgi:general secretion pathway protein D
VTLGSRRGRNRDNLLVSPIPSITLNAHLDDTDTNVLASPRIRARNREKAKIHIGDRVPVLTNSVTPVATGAPVVTGTVSYIDVGLKLEVEPDIHSDGEVGIKINMEVSNIVNQVTNPVSGTIAYQIGTRTASTVLRLKDGETQVLAGLIDDEDRRAAARIPGLGELPVLGRLFSSHRTDKKKNEIVLSITPRIVGRTRLREAQSVELWSGTESTLRSAPFSLRSTGTVSVSTSSGSALPPRTTPLPTRLTPSAAAPLVPTSFNWEGPAQAKVGDKFTLTLVTRVAEPVRSFGFQVDFDASSLKAIDAVEGTFMRQQSLPSSFTRQIDQFAGQIAVDLVSTTAQGVKGAGSLTEIIFEVIGPAPQSRISVPRVVPAGPTGEPLPSVVPGTHMMTLNP